jgi:hypothetical protein
MDALAAIGLSANIVQFVDCGIRWVSDTIELYNSANGALEENVELERVVEDLRALIRKIKAGSQFAGDRKLQSLLVICSGLADDLMALLLSLKIDGSKNHKLEIVKKSIKTFRRKGQIKEIEQRLFKVRDQLCTNLAVLLRQVSHSIEH